MANSRCILVADLDTAVAVSNEYAPEHLIIQTREPRALLAQVSSAGSVFLGEWSPESMGDYCSGTNHVLPTFGYARSYSGVSLLDFQKRITVQELSADGLRALGPTAITLSGMEGLDAHGNAVQVRLDALAGSARMSDILALARPDIVALKPYSHASWDPAFDRLHANELPWRAETDRSRRRAQSLSRAAPARARATPRRACTASPPSSCCRVAAAMSPSTCWCAASAAPASTTSCICPPTFGMYAVAARIQGAAVREVPLLAERGFALDIATACSPPATRIRRIVFLCSPNNPTGNAMDPAAIETVAGGARGQGARRRRRGVHRIRRASASLDRGAVAISESRRVAHLVEGLRPRRRARGFA